MSAMNGGSGSGSGSTRPVVITGGAGFIGSNLAHRLLQGGERVILFDDLSRPLVARNAEWLRRSHGDRVELCEADVRDAALVNEVCQGASFVVHLAAQVAVTTSLRDPVADFEVNARGTLNVLEAIRRQSSPPPLIFTSTNKVYGALPDVGLRERGLRSEPDDAVVRTRGISEARPLDFHSPYGCSKGSADQYVLDYARTFGLSAAVLRMSCIYGLRQLGSEEQGWVAHFAIQALRGAPITIYGDGLQVRDVLFADDLVGAILVARAAMPRIRGCAFNIGGGPDQTMSLLELIELLEEISGRRTSIRFEAARTGDQRWYVSDLQKFRNATGWAPHVRIRDGVTRLCAFLRDTGIGSEVAA
jgi:CDP-paratose 2-epimerase